MHETGKLAATFETITSKDFKRLSIHFWPHWTIDDVSLYLVDRSLRNGAILTVFLSNSRRCGGGRESKTLVA